MKIKYSLLILVLIVTQCQTFSEYRVRGYFLPDYYGFQTTVDSPLAQAYLNRSFSSDDSLMAVRNVVASWDNKLLNHDTLKDLASKTSTDFATLYFVKRIMEKNENQTAQKRFEDIVTSLKENDYFRHNVNKNTLFVFVPGLGYKSDKNIGADFGAQRKALQELGIPNTIIEVEEFGRIPTNAKIIAENISILSKTYSSLILVSASKSSSEVAIALGKELKPEQTHSVKAWISLCGVLRGTPFANEFKKGVLGLLTNVYLGLKGASNGVVDDMSPETMRKIYDTLEFPEHIKMIQYVPVALSGQISGRAFNGYQNMKNEGPNDGRTLLADQLIEGGKVILSFGSDHYFKDKDIKEKSMALGILAQELVSADEYTVQNSFSR